MTIINKKKRKVQEESKSDDAPPTKKPSTENTKRKAKIKSEIETNEIEKKTPQFDIKLFRKKLSDVSNRLVGLTQFLHVCSNSEDKTDFILKYLESGGSPGEILKQLEGQSHKDLLLASTVFEIFYLITLKIQSSAAHMLQSLEDTCRYFLNTYVSTLEIMLSDKSNSKQQKITLNLLTTMVMMNSELGLTVLNQLSLQPKMLGHLVKQNKANVKDDVRQSFVKFLVSFLVDNNTTLTKTLLNKQGLLAIIFPGLINDNADTILMVIQLLKKSVMENPAISKTLKIHLFSHQAISHIFNLFNWGKRIAKSERIEEELNEVKTSVNELLFILFTSTKNGIYFYDNTLGTSEIPKNRYLWKALELLEAPWNNEHAGKCIIKIISANPEMYKPIKSKIEESFDAKYSEYWLKTLYFLKNCLESIQPALIINKTVDMDPSNLANYIKNVYLSPTIIRTSKIILKSSNAVMINEVIVLLRTFVVSVQNILQLAMSDYNLLKPLKTILKSRLEEFMQKHFPNVDDLILTLHSVLDEIKEESVENYEETTVKSKLLLDLLDFLLLYNEILPNSFDPVLVSLDAKRLFEKLEFFNKSQQTELKLKAITFLLNVDKLAFLPDKPLFKEILPAMFEVLINDDVKMIENAHSILYEILDAIHIFDENKSEINILLYCVRIVAKKYDVVVLQMIVEVIENVICNANEYKLEFYKYTTDKHQIKTQRNDNIDIIFDNLENFSKSKKELYFIEDRPLFSFFIIGLFKSVNKSERFRECALDLSNKFVYCLMHFQDDPSKFFKLLSNFKNEILIDDCILGWKNKPHGVSKKVFSKNNLIYKLSTSLLSEHEINIEDTFNLKCINEWSSENLCIKIGDSIYTVDKLVNHSEILILLNIVIFYLVQQQKFDNLNLIKVSNATKALICISEMSLLVDTQEKQFYVNLLRRFLGNPDLLNNFNPFETQPSLISNMILDVFDYCNNKQEETKLISIIYRPYKNRVFLSLMKELRIIEKTKKGTVINNIEKVLNLMNLDINDASSLLVGILKLDTCIMTTETNEASSWIFIVCHILKLYTDNALIISESDFVGVLYLYSKTITELESVINVSDLELCLYNYLLVNSNFIEKVPEVVFESMFNAKHISKNTAKLGCIMLFPNERMLPIFMKYALNNEYLAKREFMIPLALAAFNHPKFKFELSVLNNIFEYFKPNIQKIIEKPQKASQIYVENFDLIKKLIFHCMSMDDCENFLKKVHKYDSLEIFHVSILETIFYKYTLSNENEPIFKYLESFLLTLLQLLIITLKKDEIQEEKIMKISETLSIILSLIFDYKNRHPLEDFNLDGLIKNTIWQNSFKFSLKALMKLEENMPVSNIIGNISSLIDLFYPQDSGEIIDFFEMTTSHSEFLNIMLSMQHSNVKNQLVRLLYVLVCKNKNVMKAVHIPVYLSAYQATRNSSDRTLLMLLRLYESNGNSMIEYRPYLWSEIGANYFALKSNRKKASLWSNPTVNHILNLLDKEMIEKTIKNFPIDEKLNYDSLMNIFSYNKDNHLIETIEDAFSIINKKPPKRNVNSMDFDKYIHIKLTRPTYKAALKDMAKKEFVDSSFSSQYSEIYDPAFLLPLLNFVVAPGSIISCHRILRCGILAIPLMALSSNCPMMRSAAYNVLHRFYAQLESEMFYKNDKLLWTQFLDTVRCSLKTALVDAENNSDAVTISSSPKLPAVCSLYLARAALVMTNPLDPLFKPINNFIISKQFINFTIVPDLLDLFHNTDITYLERRIWILKVIRDGVKSFEDIKVLLKSVTFKILLDFYSSSLSDVKSKLLILDILNSTVKIPRAAKILVDSYGLFPWLNTTFKNFSNEHKDVISQSIHLTRNLFIILNVESTSKILGNHKDDSFDLYLSGNCFRLNESLQSEFLFLLVSLINKISVVNIADLKIYLEMLKKISFVARKQITTSQIIKIVRECELIGDSSRNYCKIIMSSLLGTNKEYNSRILRTSLSIIDNSKSLTDEIVIIKLLHEIAICWLSGEAYV